MTEQQTKQPRWGRRILLGFGGFLVVVIAAIAVWWFAYDPEAQDPILATSTPVLGAQTYIVDAPASQINASFSGPAGELSSSYDMGAGTIEFTEEPGGWRMVVNLTFDARTLDVGDEAVNTLLKRILRVEEYPTGSFVATSETLIEELAGTQEVPVAGQIELAGSVQPYEVVAILTISEVSLKLSAKTVIDAALIFGEGVPGMSDDEGLDTDLLVVALPADAE